MAMETQRIAAPKNWLQAAAAFGVLWNAYGVFQFVTSFSQTPETLKEAGMTELQAATYLSLPIWVDAAFAAGVGGGLLGSVFLLTRNVIALRVFMFSLLGYVLLFIADVYYGVFAQMPGQLAILVAVLAIAALLLWTAWIARRRNLLT